MDGCGGGETIAPFVMKTYRMVSDPSTDALIRWGVAGNSFLVFNPLEFSQRVLPVYFKHNNFSSFVRQLNTYGFRKVDPDKWEFANEWFLRGQIHILKNIVRRKRSRGLSLSTPVRIDTDVELVDEDQEILIEISKLKEEQRSIEMDMKEMNRRLDATERRPDQMMAFLHKAVEDPELIPRMMLEKDKQYCQPQSQLTDKRRRMLINATSSSSSSSMATATTIKTDEEDELNLTNISSPDQTGNWCQSPDTSSTSAWFNNPLGSIHPAARGGGGGGGGSNSGYGGDRSNDRYDEGFGQLQNVDEEANPTQSTYPFSIYRGGF